MEDLEVSNIEIPQENIDKWQNIVDTLAEIMGVHDALINRIDPPYIEIFKASRNEENQLSEGDRVKLAGFFCEKVIESNDKIYIKNALKDDEWKEAPEIEQGLINYLGFPLKWPNGEMFGTICVHNTEERKIDQKLQRLMAHFQELIESHLQIIYEKTELDNHLQAREKMQQKIRQENEEIKAINKELDRSLQKNNELNNRFNKMIKLISAMVKTSHTDNEFLGRLLETAVEIIPEADYGCVYTYEDEKVEFIHCIGHNQDVLRHIVLPSVSFYSQEEEIKIAKRKSELAYIEMDDLNKSTCRILKQALKPVKERINCDLKVGGQRKAGLSIEIAAGSASSFSSNSINIINAFHSIATSFYQMESYNKLQGKFTKELIGAIIQLLEIYDLYTSGHSENVAEIAAGMAEKMGLSRQKIKDAYWAGLVHDIGKLLIPLSILNKNDSLTEDEYDLVKNHPSWGFMALSRSNSLNHIAEYVLYHHERWDGTGYPEGIQGDEIPLISQILSLADAWDAMTSRRSYRQALSEREAIREVRQNSGKQFSPRVVDVFLEEILSETG